MCFWAEQLDVCLGLKQPLGFADKFGARDFVAGAIRPAEGVSIIRGTLNLEPRLTSSIHGDARGYERLRVIDNVNVDRPRTGADNLDPTFRIRGPLRRALFELAMVGRIDGELDVWKHWMLRHPGAVRGGRDQHSGCYECNRRACPST